MVIVISELAGTVNVVVGRYPTQVGCGSSGRGFSMAVPTAATVSSWTLKPGPACAGVAASGSGNRSAKPITNPATRAANAAVASRTTTGRAPTLGTGWTSKLGRTYQPRSGL